MDIRSIKEFRKNFERKANGNNPKAHALMAKEMKRFIDEGIVDPKRVSFRAMLEGLTDFKFGANLPSNQSDAAVKMAETITGSAFPTITNVILNSVVMPEFELYSDDMMNLVTEGTARITDPEKIAGTTALGDLKRRLETHSYEEDEFGEKDITIYKGDFGKIISLTFEALYNDNTGMIMERAQTLGQIAGQHIHRTVIETLEVLPRTAFEETVSRAFVFKDTAYNAAAVYSVDHDTIDGVKNANVVTGGISEQGLENAYNAFGSMVNSRNQKIVIRATQVLVHSMKELAIKRLLSTPQELPTGDTDRTQQINVFGPLGSVTLTPLVSPFISDVNISYMGDFKKGLVWLWVERPNTVTAPTDSTLAFEKRIVYRARFNYFGGAGLRDYRYIVKITQ